MSHKAITWAWEQPVACARDRLILMALADRACTQGECYPKQEVLAEKDMCSVASVQRSLKRLIASGLVAVKRRGGTGNGRWANLYKLPVAVIVKQPAENAELQENLRELAKPQSDVLPSNAANEGGLNGSHVTYQPSLNQPPLSNSGGQGGRSRDPSDLSDLNEATATVIAGVARIFNHLAPDYTAARRFVLESVGMYGHDAVRDGYAELMAANATPGRICQPSVKTLVGYFRQAKSRPARQSKQSVSPAPRVSRAREVLYRTSTTLGAKQ